jgi:hypothetical protein
MHTAIRMGMITRIHIRTIMSLAMDTPRAVISSVC